MAQQNCIEWAVGHPMGSVQGLVLTSFIHVLLHGSRCPGCMLRAGTQPCGLVVFSIFGDVEVEVCTWTLTGIDFAKGNRFSSCAPSVQGLLGPCYSTGMEGQRHVNLHVYR